MKDLETSHQTLIERLKDGDPVTEHIDRVVPYIEGRDHLRLIKKAVRHRHKEALQQLSQYKPPDEEYAPKFASWIDSWLGYAADSVDFIADNPELVEPFIDGEPGEAWEDLYVQLRYGDEREAKLKRFERAFKALFPDQSIEPASVDELREAIKNENTDLATQLIDEHEPTITHLMEALEREDGTTAERILRNFALDELDEERRNDLLETLVSVNEQTVRAIKDELPSKMVKTAIDSVVEDMSYTSDRYVDRIKALSSALDRETYQQLSETLYTNRAANSADAAVLDVGTEEGWLDEEMLADFLTTALRHNVKPDRIKTLYDQGAALEPAVESGLDETLQKAIRSGVNGRMKVVDLILCREPEAVIKAVLQELFAGNVVESGGDELALKALMQRHDREPPDFKDLVAEAMEGRSNLDVLQYLIDNSNEELTEEIAAEAYERMTENAYQFKKKIFFLLDNDLRPVDIEAFYETFVRQINTGDPFSKADEAVIDRFYSHDLYPPQSYLEKRLDGSTIAQDRAKTLIEKLPPRQKKYLRTNGVEVAQPDEEVQQTNT